MLHNLSQEQISLIHSYIDYQRFCYNWALENWNRKYEETGKSSGYYELSTLFTEFRNKDENKWMLDFDSGAGKIAIRHLCTGFKKYFGKHCKHPHFHKKKRSKKRFGVRSSRVCFSGENNRYLGIPGFWSDDKKRLWFDCKNNPIPVGDNIKYYNGTLSFDGLNYWFSVSTVDINENQENISIEADEEPLGIDIDIRTTATLSDGTMYDPPNPYRVKILNNRIKKIEKATSRDRRRRLDKAAHMRVKYDDIPKSNNQIKRERKLIKAYQDLHNLYDTHFHKVSKSIADKHPSFIVLERTNFRSMGRKSKLFSKNFSKVPLYTLSKYIEYKCADNGSTIIKAPYDFKSTKICYRCGNETDIGKSKIYRCPCCGLEIDRDINAAYNLLDYGKKLQSI